MTSRSIVESVYRTALAACNPREATRAAVSGLVLDGPPLLLAVGKAAPSMALGALDVVPIVAGGMVVSETGTPGQVGPLAHLRGDHPVPGDESAAAAEAIGATIEAHRGVRDAIVLVSGGATSLVAAPVPPLTGDDLRETFERLLSSGATIDEMNAVRRRVLRWAGGRMAAALAPARVHTFVVSDVMSGDITTVGSGPCFSHTSGSPLPSNVVQALPPRLRAFLDRGAAADAPSPATARIVLDNRSAVDAACDALAARGLPVVRGAPLVGEASQAARAIGARLSSLGHGGVVAGGETTVTLPPDAPHGGRCQELALALAREVAGTPWTVLVAGTDGRDGPTDAAGAVVDGNTWAAIAAAGRDPATDLERHDAHAALDAVGALLRTGPTGTNVNDLLVAVR